MRRRDELFATSLSLSVSTPVDTQRVVFVLVSHVPNIYLACLHLSHGMKFRFLRRPHSIFMCQCFQCCSSRNELRDEKWFCSDSLTLCLANDVRVRRVCSSDDCDHGGDVLLDILRVIVWAALTRIFRGLALFHGRGKVACVLRMFLGWLHRSSSLCIPPADDECSRDVLRVAKSDGCCVCRCVLE